MNIQIQGGGGGTYSNSGSCGGVVSYLEHEDYLRQEQGFEVEKFFDARLDTHTSAKVTKDIDSNKAKLCKNEAKFFVITISPSKEELQALGKTTQEQSQRLKEYSSNVMTEYARNFNKGLSKYDLKFYGKVHHERSPEKGAGNMHVHIIVSRKDMENRLKLSPQTNHRGTSKGAVKGGFDRNNFRQKSEELFDRATRYERDYKNTFEYQNTMKNGTLKDIEKVSKKLVQREQERGRNSEKNNMIENKLDLNKMFNKRQEQPKEIQQEQEENKKRGRGR